MKKMILLAGLVLASQSFAQDLVLPGAKWFANFNGYVCKAFEEKVARPDVFEQLNVNFERVTTDSSLDNALLTATFEENGQACRYNAILFADNAAQTSKLVESKAYSQNEAADCSAGKAILDAAFTNNQYLYYGHPHNLAFVVSGVGSESRCAGAGTIGVNFVVAGKLPTNPVK